MVPDVKSLDLWRLKIQPRPRERVAPEAGFDRTYISLVDRGVTSPTVWAVVKLAAVLQVRPSEIMRRMEAHLAKGRKPPRGGKFSD